MPLLEVPTLMPTEILVECGDGVERWVRYTSKHTRQAVANGNAMLKAGLTVPVCWMHDKTAKPVYLSGRPFERNADNPHDWLAKGFIGYVRRWKYDPATDEAVAVVEIEDEADAEQFLRVGKVSPGVEYDHKDETGRVWGGTSITHIASTPKPKQRHIGKARRVADRDAAFEFGAISGAGGKSDLSAVPHPGLRSVLLSFDSTIRANAMTEPEEDDDGPPEVAVAEVPVPAAETPKAPTGDQRFIQSFIEILRECGIHVEGDVRDLEQLEIAARSAAATKRGGAATDANDHEDDEMKTDEHVTGGGGEEAHAPAGGQPFYMSWSPEQMAFCKSAAQHNHDRYADRIRQLCKDGKIDVPTRDRLLAELTKVNLSHEPHTHFTAKFEFREPTLAVKIAAYEELPKGKFSADAIQKGNANAQTLSHQPMTAPATPGDPALEKPGGEAAEMAAALAEAKARMKRQGIATR